jgi:uncharacterized DUF497 family protein
MKITYDPVKRQATLKDRGLDFEDASAVFMGTVFDIPDARREYGEPRVRTVGYLNGRMVMVVWTPRGEDRHVFSMRKTNEREQARFRKQLGEG